MNRGISTSGYFSKRFLLVSLALTCGLGGAWLSYDVSHFHQQQKQAERAYLQKNRDLLKWYVDQAVRYVEYEQTLVEKRTRDQLRERVCHAHNLLAHLYEEYKDDMDPEKLRTLFCETLRDMRFGDSQGYLFATSMDGIAQVAPNDPEIEGTSVIDVVDAQGRRVIQGLIEVARTQGEGFYEYTWTKPEDEGQDHLKISFVKHFKPFDWYIGAGAYRSDMTETIQQETADWLERITFGDEDEHGYIFACSWDGISMTAPVRGKNVIDVKDKDGVPIVKELIRLSKEEGEGYLQYVRPKFSDEREIPKLSYVRGIKEWEWYVGAGMNLAHMEARAQIAREELNRAMVYSVTTICSVLLAGVILSMFLSSRMTRRLANELGRFGRFFDEAATGEPAIACEQLTFQELRQLAAEANKMIVERREAQQALRESEMRIHELIQSAPDAFFAHRADGQLVEVNKRACESLGYTREELLTMSAQDIALEGAAETLQQFWDDVANGRPCSFDGTHRRKDGTTFPVNVTVAVLPSEGELLFYGFARDVTEQKASEEALNQSRAWIESVLRAAPIGIGVVTNRMIQEANDAICSMVGYTRKELIGHKSRMLYLSDEEFDRVGREKYNMIKAQGTGTIETRWQHKNGTILDIILSSTPLDMNDWSKGVTFAALDITKRKKSEQALRESERLFRATFERAAIGVVNTAPEGTLLRVNQRFCDMVGYTREELTTMTVREMTHPDDLPGDTILIRQLLEGTIPTFTREKRYIRKDGPIVWARATVSTMQDSDGNVEYMIAIIEDISDRKAMELERDSLESQLRHSQKMEAVGRLAGGVAHDFNNLLQAIQGCNELAMMNIDGDHPSHEYMLQVGEASARAARLVSQLLAFSRRQLIKPEDLDLNEVISSTNKMLERVIGEHIHIRFIPAEQLSVIHADRGMMEQVLMNLAVNARDAMPDGGTLTIETQDTQLNEKQCEAINWAKPGRYVQMRVTDTGHGMAEDTIENIWEPFYTTKGPGKGTGLGLATVYGIVRQHDGMIEVDSKPDSGASFRIYLPATDRPASKHNQATEEPTTSGGTETILLAEDDELVRNLIYNTLTNVGYHVLTAKNGKRAIDLFTQHRDSINLLLLDVIMPQMGGREVYEHIIEIAPDIPVLFSSGYSDDTVHTNFVLNEGVQLIQKPYKTHELLKMVRRLLDVSANRRDTT